MKKIFKKSLAIMVSAAICLTALIGCLSVSAAEGDAPVYTVVSAEGKKGGTVGVNVTGDDLTKICGQSVDIKFAAGLEIVKVYDNDEKRDLVRVNDETGGEYNILSNEDGTKTVRLVDIINFPEYGETPALVTASFDVTISVTIPADAVAGTEYPISIDESQFADYNEAWVYPTLNKGKITVVEDAPSCEHQWEAVSADPATLEKDGSVTLKCSLCKEEKNEVVEYNATYKNASYATDYSEEISLVFYARKDKLGTYEDAFCYFSHNISGVENKITIKGLDEAKDSTYGPNKRPAKSWSYAVKPMQLTETVNSYVFVCTGGKWYSGENQPTSVASYAQNYLNHTPNVKDTEKYLIANMLNYGTKMQLWKNYNVNDLASDYLGDFASYVTTSIPDISDEIVTDQDTETGVYFNKFVFDMASKTQVQMYFRSDKYTGENKTDFTITAEWLTEGGVSKQKVYSLDGENTYTNELQNGSPRPNRYYFVFDGLKAADFRQNITFKIYDGDLVIATYTVSVSSLLAAGLRDGAWPEQAEQDAYYAMINYGDAAANHF